MVVALAYGLNPATLYDAAHFGQTDPLVGLVLVTCLAACYWRSGLLLGIGAAGLLHWEAARMDSHPDHCVGRPEPLEPKRLTTAAIGAIVTLSVLVSPWTFTGRANHVWRYLDNLSGHDIANRVISADAHNLWWIPTLLNGDWIEDSIPFVGPLSYRMVAGGLALMWFAFCLLGLRRGAPGGFSFAAAAASFGFFMLMTRAHENHGYLALTLLVCALATHPDRRLWAIAGLVSVGLLANLVLRDPLVMGAFTSVPDPGQDPPPLVVALQLANIAVFGTALALVGRVLGSRLRARTNHRMRLNARSCLDHLILPRARMGSCWTCRPHNRSDPGCPAPELFPMDIRAISGNISMASGCQLTDLWKIAIF